MSKRLIPFAQPLIADEDRQAMMKVFHHLAVLDKDPKYANSVSHAPIIIKVRVD